MTFRVGQKVVCVKQSIGKLHDLGLPGFEKGRIYTISELYEIEPHGVFLSVYELDSRVGGQVCGFRPVVERDTDISIFTEILRTTKAPVNADARCFVGSQQGGAS